MSVCCYCLNWWYSRFCTVHLLLDLCWREIDNPRVTALMCCTMSVWTTGSAPCNLILLVLLVIGLWTPCWTCGWTTWRCAARFSNDHSWPVSESQLNTHLLQTVSHAIVHTKSATLSTYSPQLFELDFVWCWSVDVSPFLCRWHCVLSLCDFESIFLVCLIELSVFYGSVFFLNVTGFTPH